MMRQEAGEHVSLTELPEGACGVMRLCERPAGHDGPHMTSVERAERLAPSRQEAVPGDAGLRRFHDQLARLVRADAIEDKVGIRYRATSEIWEMFHREVPPRLDPCSSFFGATSGRILAIPPTAEERT